MDIVNQISVKLNQNDHGLSTGKRQIFSLSEHQPRARVSNFALSNFGHSAHAHVSRSSMVADLDLEAISSYQAMASYIVTHPLYQLVMITCILSHMALTIHETNQNAINEKRDLWQGICEECLMALYVTDLFLRIFIQRSMFPRHFMNLFDFAIVVVDILCAVLNAVFPGSFDVGPISLLRALRTLRIVRVMRNFIAFRDLYLMVKGMIGALRPIFFSFLLILSALTIFSIASVELIHPVNKRLAAKGVYAGCNRCHRAFSSVMSANLTFFSSIVAGDSWGKLSIPIIEENPFLSIIILTAFTILELGLLNVVVAVVVDRQAQAREEDKALQHTLKEEKVKASHKELIDLFRQMDGDHSGGLSLKELKESYRSMEQFRMLMESVDVTEDDLDTIFASMDRDGGGSVDYEEFVMELHRMRSMEVRTLLYITRQHVLETKASIQKLEQHFLGKSVVHDDACASSPDAMSTASHDSSLAVGESGPRASLLGVGGSPQRLTKFDENAAGPSNAANTHAFDTIVQNSGGWEVLEKNTFKESTVPGSASPTDSLQGNAASLPPSRLGVPCATKSSFGIPLAKEGSCGEHTGRARGTEDTEAIKDADEAFGLRSLGWMSMLVPSATKSHWMQTLDFHQRNVPCESTLTGIQTIRAKRSA